MIKETLNRTSEFEPGPRTEIEQGIFDLGMIAGEWRDTKDDQYIEEYHERYQHLRDLGWKGALDFDEQLPARFMPEDYLERFGLERE